MRPRGLRVPWRRATATYWYEPRQPTRAAELAEALALEDAAPVRRADLALAGWATGSGIRAREVRAEFNGSEDEW